MNRPNILIVMTDQQRADLRRSRGYALDTMPFLDEWAKQGVDFCRAYTSNPSCMPARVSMLTGRYPQSHRVRTNHNAADAFYSEDLLDLLHREGYTCALFGKNHTHRRDEDFDVYETNGHLGGLPERTDEEKAFGAFLRASRNMESHLPSPGGLEVQQPYRNVSAMLRFLDERPQDNPFFAWVSFAEPHNPAQAPEPYFDLFPPESLPPPGAGPEVLGQKGPRYTWLRGIWERVFGEDLEKRANRAVSNYCGMLRLIDDQLRRLMDGLRERDLEKDTLILFLSDHGDYAGEYGLTRKGGDLPEVLCRIPMIWRGPGVAARGALDGVCASIVDILPTLCELWDVPSPLGCQGKSLLPILRGEDFPPEEYESAYAETGYGGLYWTEEDGLDPIAEGATNQYRSFDCLNSWTESGQVRMLRWKNYKIQLDMLGQGYLYDLEADPHETRNLWDDPALLAVRADLLLRLSSAMLRESDALPLPRRRYRLKTHPRGYWFQRYVSPDPGVREAPVGRKER
ncbi:MAG: sulfatase-like hydrolase/transferase [Provencibacterium sp.]|jgi:arylsulfatase A-like enzyme|nr:sulfatase-like hydrolase/transferase [Provencibacterium sp.]